MSITDITPKDNSNSGDTGPASRLGLWALALGVGGFLAWALLAPLGEGVPSQGMVSLDTKRKAVQHLSGGVVRDVLVKEGELVKEGQVLIHLDDVTANANAVALKQKYLGLRAVESRLLAEQKGLTRIAFHPDVLVAMTDPLVKSQVLTQEQLFQSRRMGLQADLRAIEESILGQQGALQSYEGMLKSRLSQRGLLEEEWRHTVELVKEGYTPRNRQLELERMRADTNASIAELNGNLVRSRQSIAELRQRALSRQQEYRKEVDTQLSEVTREAQGDGEKLVAVQADLARTVLKAPASGQVVGLSVQTVGGVIQPGQKLMDIVPENEPLLLEARIEPHLIDKVRTGLPTDIRFSAFSHSPQLVVAGEVQSISKDLLSEQQGNAVIAYYLARVKVTPEGLKTLGHRQLQPGMPAEMVIRTGERTLFTYMVSPLYKRVATSMKEE